MVIPVPSPTPGPSRNGNETLIARAPRSTGTGGKCSVKFSDHPHHGVLGETAFFTYLL